MGALLVRSYFKIRRAGRARLVTVSTGSSSILGSYGSIWMPWGVWSSTYPAGAAISTTSIYASFLMPETYASPASLVVTEVISSPSAYTSKVALGRDMPVCSSTFTMVMLMSRTFSQVIVTSLVPSHSTVSTREDFT